MHQPFTNDFTAGPPRRILAISGSARRGSYNRMLLEAAAELAPAGVVLEVYDRVGTLPHFDEDLEAATGGGPAAVRELRALVEAADGVLIATPEYNHSLPGTLKNALDWLSRGDPASALAGKPAAVVGATTGQWGTRLAQAAVRQALFSCEAPVLTGPAVYVREADRRFDASGRLTDEPTRAALRELLAAFAGWIDRFAPVPASAAVE